MHLLFHLKQALLDLHAAWILWILIGLLAASLVVMVERALFFRSVRGNLRRLAGRLDQLLLAGQVREAVKLLSESPTPAAAVALAGLRRADLGPVAAEKAMVGAAALERMRLERGLTFLGTLGNNAPFIGLLGTVIGVIEAFEGLGQSGSGPAVGPGALMSGISEALVATAVGLFVAIPAVAAFNFFTRQIQSLLANTEALTNVVLCHLSADAPVNAASVQASPGLEAS